MVLEKEEQPVEPYEPERLSHCSVIYTTHRRKHWCDEASPCTCSSLR